MPNPTEELKAVADKYWNDQLEAKIYSAKMTIQMRALEAAGKGSRELHVLTLEREDCLSVDWARAVPKAPVEGMVRWLKDKGYNAEVRWGGRFVSYVAAVVVTW